MPSKKAVKPKVPKGYTDEYTTYELITKTTYSKPWKEPKRRKGRSKVVKAKEYVQPVRIVGGIGGKKKSNTSRKSKRY